MSHADERSLRLAAPALTAAELDAYLRYQQAWLDQPRADLAAAHLAALQASGLAASRHQELRAVVDEFCARRWTAEVLEARAAKDAPARTPKEEILAEANRLRDLEPLIARYGAPNVQLLVEREPRLMALYRRVRATL